MKITIVEAMDPCSPSIGGADTYSRNLLEYLLKTGAGVTLLGFRRNSSRYSDERLSFIPVAHKKNLTGYEYLPLR
jgi:hypothetical protein